MRAVSGNLRSVAALADKLRAMGASIGKPRAATSAAPAKAAFQPCLQNASRVVPARQPARCGGGEGTCLTELTDRGWPMRR